MIKPHHRIAITLAFAYLLAVALILFWPSPVDKPVIKNLHETLSWAHSYGLPKFIDYPQIEFTANIALFVPMGLIIATLFKSFWAGTAGGALISCLVELSQGLFLPNRFASGLDVLANTTGAAIGAAVYLLFIRRVIRRTSPTAASHASTRATPDTARIADTEKNDH